MRFTDVFSGFVVVFIGGWERLFNLLGQRQEVMLDAAFMSEEALSCRALRIWSGGMSPPHCRRVILPICMQQSSRDEVVSRAVDFLEMKCSIHPSFQTILTH